MQLNGFYYLNLNIDYKFHKMGYKIILEKQFLIKSKN